MTSCESVFSNSADHGGGGEGGDEVDLQPGVTQLQAARERRVEALLLVDADHLTGLGGNLDRLVAEQFLAADQALQHAVRVADRIDRIMADHRRLQRLVQLHVLAEGIDVLQHDLVEPGLRRRQQHVAHHHHADELPVLLGDVAIGDHRRAGELAQRLDRLGDGHFGAEDAERRRHQVGDLRVLILAVVQVSQRLFGHGREHWLRTVGNKRIFCLPYELS